MPSPRSSPAFSSSDLISKIRDNGLEVLGSFELDHGEYLFPDRSAEPSTVTIIGNIGSAIWPHYQTARQIRPALSLDQWTRDVVGRIAKDFDLDAVYPFEGPPYHPFIQWVKRTGTLFSSPLGLTIHPTYGLWHAFRAALLFEHAQGGPKATATCPCDDCEDRPCLSACPVGAFTEEGYDFKACLDHLSTPINPCRDGGCLARIACPVGRQYRYQENHAAFHMEQLLKARGRW